MNTEENVIKMRSALQVSKDVAWYDKSKRVSSVVQAPCMPLHTASANFDWQHDAMCGNLQEAIALPMLQDELCNLHGHQLQVPLSSRDSVSSRGVATCYQ